MRGSLRSPLLLLAALAVLAGLTAAGVFAETINPLNDGSRYAWSENTGWLNAEPSGNGGPGITVSGLKLTGYMWGENIGWVNLSCENRGTCGSAQYGVTNDGVGHLGGYAWSENAGWISFSCQNSPSSCASTGNYGVSIDPATGVFSGNAWGENIGWISFSDTSPVAYKAQTADDADGVPAASDNCPFDYNPGQANNDGERIPVGRGPGALINGQKYDVTNPMGDNKGDACDTDNDNDGLSNTQETTNPACPSASGPTDPLKPDTDGDGALDGYECLMGTDPANATSKPPVPACIDTDGDFVPDGTEVRGWGTNPSVVDSDGDGKSDGVEVYDVTGDSVVNFNDALQAAKAAAGVAPFNPPGSLTAIEKHAYDMNRDGVVNFFDALLIAKRAAGLPPC